MQGWTLANIGHAGGYHRSTTDGQGNIPVVHRTTTATRKQLPVEVLRPLNVHDELTAREIAEQFNTTAQHVLRDLHNGGVPDRRGGSLPLRGGTVANIRLLTHLYGDPATAAVGRDHQIPFRRRPGPLAKRFPIPAPLNRQLLNGLYNENGLSSHHIDLPNGQPAGRLCWLADSRREDMK